VIGNPAGVSAPGGPAVSAVHDASTGQLFGFLGAWSELTDGKFWRSLGWLLLGIALMFLGVLWWLGPSSARMSPVGLAARQLG
jgi:hypothetical protein